MVENAKAAALDIEASVDVKGKSRPVPFLMSVGLLYVSFGVIFGVLQGGLPPILRSQGVDVGALGWLVAIVLPFGLTFIWAPLIDRFSLGFRRPRIAWITAMQFCTCLLLIAIAYFGTGSMTVLFVLALGIAFAAATMDIALDGLAASGVRPSDRVFAGGMKVASLSIGSIIGGGLFVVCFHRLGWTNLFIAVAALTLLATLPALAQRERPHAPADGAARKPSLVATFRQPEHRRHLFILSMLSLPIAMLFGLNRVMLVDAGVALDQIGSIAGTLSPLGGLVATLIAVASMRRLGTVAALLAFTAVCLLAAGLVVAAFLSGDAAIFAILGAILATAGSSGFYVVICAMVLGWANTNQAATDYAALYGISRLCALIALMIASQAISVIGWAGFYILASLLLLATVFQLARSGFLEQINRAPAPRDLNRSFP